MGGHEVIGGKEGAYVSLTLPILREEGVVGVKCLSVWVYAGDIQGPTPTLIVGYPFLKAYRCIIDPIGDQLVDYMLMKKNLEKKKKVRTKVKGIC